DDLVVHNFSDEATFCTIEILVGCDFADLFEVKERRIEKVGEVRTAESDGSVEFSYRRGNFRRGARVTLSEPPEMSAEIITYRITVPPRGEWQTCMQLTPVIDDRPITPRHLCGRPVERSTPLARLESWRRRLPV